MKKGRDAVFDSGMKTIIMKNIYSNLLYEIKKGTPLVLATIVATEGSTPQVPGVSALFSTGSLVTGTLGGGILEADALKRSQTALQDQVSRLYRFSLDEGENDEEGAVCGGAVQVILDAVPEKHVEAFVRMKGELEARRPGILLTHIEAAAGDRVSLSRFWVGGNEDLSGTPAEGIGGLTSQIEKSLSRNIPFLKSRSDREWLFFEPVIPSPRLIIAGAGHIGRALSHLGSLLDFEVTVIDDREDFANRKRLPDADHIIVDDIARAVSQIPGTSDTFFVIVTRGHAQDEAVLKECIDSAAAYIGMIGSRNKIAHAKKNALEKGWATKELWQKIHTPIGLPILSKTVEEIAVSIAAELVLVRRQHQEEGA